jgi:hypothetical protein
MFFNIRVNTNSLSDGLSYLEKVQIPFAVSLGLNRVANDAQKAEREHITKSFHLRNKAFNLNGIYISKADRATKSSWRVVIQVQADRDYLDRFETGGYKMPSKGRFLWKPNPEVFKGGIIQTGNPLNPHNLHFTRRGGSLQGNEQTFMVKTKKTGQTLVLQRVDRGLSKKSQRTVGKMNLDSFKGGMGPAEKREKYSLHRNVGIRMLYQLVSRTTIPASLEFVPTITRTVNAQWSVRMQEAMAQAMESAR